MPLVIKSVGVQRKVWDQLRINAELSGVPLRDFITYLILNSRPIPEEDRVARGELSTIGRSNREARQTHISPFAVETAGPPQPASEA